MDSYFKVAEKREEPKKRKWKIKDFNQLQKIGEGTYGIVYKAIDMVTNKLMALKKIKFEGDEEGIPATAIREISILTELKHPNIVALEDVILDDTKLYLVFEFMSMDLKNFLDKYGGPLPTDLVKSLIYQMCQALCFCHQRRIFHRDLKPQNILMDKNTNTVKLADFGLARAFGVPLRAYTHEIVTLWYRAPEVLLGVGRYSTGVDIWSVGCIFAELFKRRPLFHGDSEIDQLFAIFRLLSTPNEEKWPGLSNLGGYKPTFPRWDKNRLSEKVGEYFDERGLELLEGMLLYDPLRRISAKAILRHDYFADLDKTKLPAGPWDGELQLSNRT